MKELKKRFLVGMLAGVLIFIGGLGTYKILTSEVLENIENIQQISAIKQIIQQAGEMVKTSNNDVRNTLLLIKI